MLALISPFWREEEFDQHERELISALFIAHHKSTFRDNPSTLNVLNAAAGSGQLANAIAAALLAMGSKHAPLVETARFLAQDDPTQDIAFLLMSGSKIPGWGGTFQKGAPDPLWHDLDQMLRLRRPSIFQKLEDITEELHGLGKDIFPNPSAYTASISIALGMPSELTPYLFIASRLTAWTQLTNKVIQTQTNHDHQRPTDSGT